MALRLECIVSGCEAVVNSETEEEVMNQVAEHARDAHGLEEIDSAMAENIKSAIQQD